MIAFSIQSITWFFLLHNCTIILSFLSGVCWILTSFLEDNEEDVHIWKNLKNNRMEMKRKFVDIIKFHSDAKQLSIRNWSFFIILIWIEMNPFFARFVYDFLDIYEIVITSYYLWSILAISSTLLVIRVEMVWFIAIILNHLKLKIIDLVQILAFSVSQWKPCWHTICIDGDLLGLHSDIYILRFGR